jgi:hypothetical protein
VERGGTAGEIAMDTFFEKLSELEAMRPELYRQKQFSQVEDKLNQLLLLAVTADERLAAQAALVSHHYFTQNDGGALQILEEQFRENPHDLGVLIGLTEHFHYYSVDFARAASFAELALKEAFRQQSQVRQVLGIRVRIAIKNEDYDLVRDSITGILSYVPPAESIDVAFEGDFIADIPPGAIDASLIDRYSSKLHQVDGD